MMVEAMPIRRISREWAWPPFPVTSISLWFTVDPGSGGWPAVTP